MKRLKLVLFPIILFLAIVFTGTIIKAALPTTVSVTVKSYFYGQTPIVNTASDKAYGTKVSFESSLGSVEGHTFVCWFVNGIVRLDLNVSTEFYATENMVLEAVFSPTSEHAVMFLDSNGKLLEVQYVENQGNATDITEGLPTKPGYIISSTNKWGKELTNITGDTFMVLQYEKSVASTFTIAVNNGTGAGTYNFNEVVTVVANAPEEDMYFSHWTDGTYIVSRQASYTFTVLQARTLTAVYSESAPSVAPFVTLSTNLNIRENYFSYLGQFSIPNGYDLVEYGLVSSKIETSFTLSSSIITKIQSNKYNMETFEFLMSLPNTSHKSIRAYLIYKFEGNLFTIYSEVISTITPDLFISEYGESSSNKWIEIYNPTTSPITLSGYSIKLFSNGASSASSTYNLTGTLNGQEVLLIHNGSTTLSQYSGVNNGVSIFNGDDAIGLYKNDVLIDQFGVIGIDPGAYWIVGDGTTDEHTIVRKSNIVYPNSVWDTTEWIAYSGTPLDYVGYHINRPSPSEITINGSSNEIQVSESIQLNAIVYPRPSIQTVVWTSSNSNIVSVNEGGLATGISLGSATIYATSTENDEIVGSYSLSIVEASGPINIIDQSLVGTTGSPPTGWVYSGLGSAYADGSLKLDSTNDYIQTPTFTISSTSLVSVLCKSNVVNTAGSIILKGYDAANTEFILNEFTIPTGTTSFTYTYSLTNTSIKKLRVVYSKNVGNLGIYTFSLVQGAE